MIFVLKYQTRRPTFSKGILGFIHTHQILFSKDVPYFFGSQLSCLARYQKILKEYSFECKNLLNFPCHTMKLQKCHHPNVPNQFMLQLECHKKTIMNECLPSLRLIL